MFSTKIFVGEFRAMLQRVLQETEDYSNDSASRTTNTTSKWFALKMKVLTMKSGLFKFCIAPQSIKYVLALVKMSLLKCR